MRGALLVLVLALSLVSPAAARWRPLPADQVTPQAQTWLARAFVAEAGWTATRDHAGIAHVLARRWRRVVRRYPTLRFVDMVRDYCTALEPSLRELSERQRWLRGLGGPEQPDGWPARKASWERHRPLWRGALDRAGAFMQGRVADPCRGRAIHWGGLMDIEGAPEGLVPVDCGETRNIFLGVAPMPDAEIAVHPLEKLTLDRTKRTLASSK